GVLFRSDVQLRELGVDPVDAAFQAFAIEGDAAVAGFLGDPGGGLLAGVVRGGGHVGGPRGRDGVVVGGVRGRRGGGRYRHGRRERGGVGGRCCGGRGLGGGQRGLHA